MRGLSEVIAKARRAREDVEALLLATEVLDNKLRCRRASQRIQTQIKENEDQSHTLHIALNTLTDRLKGNK